MKTKRIDWEKIEVEYRAGQFSIREIARQHSCAEASIRKKAKKESWTRDLTDKVRQRVRDKLVRSEVRTSNAREGVAHQSDTPTDNEITDDEIIEAAATRGAEIQNVHRKDIRRGQEMVRNLTAQLAECAKARTKIEGEIEEATKDDKGVQRRNLMMKAVSLPSHAGVLRDLSVALKNLIPLERQAYSLDDGPAGRKGKAITDDSDPFVLFPSDPMTIAEWEAQCEEADRVKAEAEAAKTGRTDSNHLTLSTEV